MSTQKNEQYHILSPDWLERQLFFPEDTFIKSTYVSDDGWSPSNYGGKVMPLGYLQHWQCATQRTDLPPEAYATPPTDTTGSGREGETPETDKAFNEYDGVRMTTTELRIIVSRMERQRDAALAQVEALRRDGERVKEELRHWHSVANDFANRAEISAADLREELESKLDEEQGKRDKLQRHFAVTERRLLEELEVEREALRAAGAVCARFERERSEAEKRIKELEAELQRTARFLESQADSPHFTPRHRSGFRAAAECARNAISDR